jgi:hypothetical protein
MTTNGSTTLDASSPAPTPTADGVAPVGAVVTALVVRTDQENADYIRQRFGEVQSGKRAASATTSRPTGAATSAVPRSA